MMTSLLDGIIADNKPSIETLGATEDLAHVFLREDRTLLDIDSKTAFMAKINGTSIPATAELNQGAELVRATSLFQERSDGIDSYSISLTIRPCQIDVMVDVGEETGEISLTELIRAIYNGGISDPNKKVSESNFRQILNSASILGNTQTMITQHFGVLYTTVNDFMNWGLDSGGTDITESIPIEKRNSIEQVISWGDKTPKPKIKSMLLGASDREISKYGSGFENLVSAQVENFTRILSLKRTVRALTEELNQPDTAEDRQSEIRETLPVMRKAASQWANHWGGAHPKIEIDPNDPDKWERATDYNPTNVPVGNFTFIEPGSSDENPETIEWSFWSRREELEAEAAERLLTPGTSAEDDDKEPF